MNDRLNLPLHSLRPVPVQTRQVTIAGTAGTLASLGAFSFDPRTEWVLVAIETAPVRVDPGGQTPTSSAGQLINAGDRVQMSIAEATLGQWIRSTGVSATAQVTQYTT